MPSLQPEPRPYLKPCAQCPYSTMRLLKPGLKNSWRTTATYHGPCPRILLQYLSRSILLYSPILREEQKKEPPQARQEPKAKRGTYGTTSLAPWPPKVARLVVEVPAQALSPSRRSAPQLPPQCCWFYHKSEALNHHQKQNRSGLGAQEISVNVRPAPGHMQGKPRYANCPLLQQLPSAAASLTNIRQRRT